MKSTAVFLDRDGTIIDDCGYVSAPEQVSLIAGAAKAVRRLRDAGWLVIVASNQSGVARGYFTEEAMHSVHARVEELLNKAGARLDAAYYCPFLDGPEACVAQYRKNSDMRKPKPGMLLEAAGERDIDLSKSWMIGDSLRDVEAGARAGCRTIWIQPSDASSDGCACPPTFTAASLSEAVDLLEA